MFYLTCGVPLAPRDIMENYEKRVGTILAPKCTCGRCKLSEGVTCSDVMDDRFDPVATEREAGYLCGL